MAMLSLTNDGGAMIACRQQQGLPNLAQLQWTAID
jgi:hypothetical protein